MKTLGRILIILVVFTIFAGLMVTAVNASGLNAPDFDGDGAAQFRPGGDAGEFRPEGDENRPERDAGSSRLIFGVIKNVIVIGFLVTVIVLLKSFLKKKKKTAVVITANGKL